ncbi:MAG: hypothetical protein ABIG44_10340 [Planctomycetota bacterium]
MPLVACPGCKTRYKVPTTAAGKRTKCRKCGKTFQVPTAAATAKPTPPKKETTPIDLDDVFSNLSALASGEALGVAPITPASSTTAAGGYSVELAARQAGVVTAVAADVEPPGFMTTGVSYVRYLAAIGKSLVFLRKPGNILTFIMLWLLLAAREMMQMACYIAPLVSGPYFFGAGAFIITGWYMAFKMTLVTWAAGGDDELPPLAAEDGFWDGVIIPFFRMLATYVFALLPFVIYLITLQRSIYSAYYASESDFGLGGTPVPAMVSIVILLALLLLGCFIWPMMVLVVSCGESVKALFQLDLILATIFKTLPAYLLTVIAVYITFVGQLVTTAYIATRLGQPIIWSQDWTAILVIPSLLVGVRLFFDIVAMRAIGYYYCYFKHKFAWSWG